MNLVYNQDSQSDQNVMKYFFIIDINVFKLIIIIEFDFEFVRQISDYIIVKWFEPKDSLGPNNLLFEKID